MIIEYVRFISLIHQALSEGAIIASPRVNWDVSLHCENPYQVILESFPSKGIAEKQIYDCFDQSIRAIYLDTPCRKCPTCLKNRSRFWQKRATYEIMRSQRTWMVTFTIAPEARFVFSLKAGSRDYHASYQEISKEMTLVFKRLRKAGHKFRYLMVAESHKDGYPHIHWLCHEVAEPIPKRIIQEQWRFGFTHCKLVSSVAAARYVTKYLAKDMKARVRASQRYGREVDVIDLQFGKGFFTFGNREEIDF